jgi:hypothetical protein
MKKTNPVSILLLSILFTVVTVGIAGGSSNHPGAKSER